MITAPALASLLAVAGDVPQPSPSPTEPAMTIYTVTPGISGFIAFFVLAMVGWLLFRSLVKQMRKVDRAAARREEPAAARAASETPDSPRDDGADSREDRAGSGEDRAG